MTHFVLRYRFFFFYLFTPKAVLAVQVVGCCVGEALFLEMSGCLPHVQLQQHWISGSDSQLHDDAPVFVLRTVCPSVPFIRFKVMHMQACDAEVLNFQMQCCLAQQYLVSPHLFSMKLVVHDWQMHLQNVCCCSVMTAFLSFRKKIDCSYNFQN